MQCLFSLARSIFSEEAAAAGSQYIRYRGKRTKKEAILVSIGFWAVKLKENLFLRQKQFVQK